MRGPLGRIVIAGVAFTAAMTTLVVTEARLGTPIFFACVAVAAAAYASILALIWSPAASGPFAPAPSPAGRRLFFLALAFAVVFRAPLAAARVDAGSDMFRYIWDGRVQRLGYNPYAVLPADPDLAATHDDDNTRLMDSRLSRTPYPPAAQLFFRAVVTVRDSVYAMKLALVACDLITMLIVWRWLLVIGRSEWLTLAYAWNPLVVLEAAFSGHVDVLCALWISACAYWIARRRTAPAAVALTLAVASKLLPIVLIPLLWRRIRVRDGVLGGAVLAALYLPFAAGSNPLFGIDNVVASNRFNGPLFLAIRTVTTPTFAAACAVLLGLAVGAGCRFRLAADEPAAWAWPLAAALAAAPVVYPWYLVSMAPFLLVPATLPLIAWTLGVMVAYVVWEIALAGGPWVVPAAVLWFEYGLVVALGLFAWRWRLRRCFRPA